VSEIVAIEERLRRFTTAPDDADWQDVLRRAGLNAPRPATPPPRPRSHWTHRRAVVAIVVAVLALVGTSVAIADRLGAFDGGPFNGIGAAHHRRTGRDVIDPTTRAYLERKNCGLPICAPMIRGERLETSHRIGRIPSGRNIYVFTTTWKGLCYVLGPPPPDDFNCSRPLGRAHPSTAFIAGGADPSDDLAFGIARDGVTSISFELNGHEVTVPVRNNVWTYRSDSTSAREALRAASAPTRSLTARFADGRNVVDQCPTCLSRRILRRLGLPKSRLGP